MTSEKTFQVPETTEVTLQELNDILITAVEGGINYWAQIKDYKWENTEIASVKVRDFDGLPMIKNPWIEVNAMDILRVLPIIKNHSGQAKTWNIREIVDNHDADIADIAVQLAVFGKVIYG